MFMRWVLHSESRRVWCWLSCGRGVQGPFLGIRLVSPLGLGQHPHCHGSAMSLSRERETALLFLPWGGPLLLGPRAELMLELWKWTLTNKGQCKKVSKCWRPTIYTRIKKRTMQASWIVIAINATSALPVTKQTTAATMRIWNERNRISFSAHAI